MPHRSRGPGPRQQEGPGGADTEGRWAEKVPDPQVPGPAVALSALGVSQLGSKPVTSRALAVGPSRLQRGWEEAGCRQICWRVCGGDPSGGVLGITHLAPSQPSRVPEKLRLSQAPPGQVQVDAELQPGSSLPARVPGPLDCAGAEMGAGGPHQVLPTVSSCLHDHPLLL